MATATATHELPPFPVRRFTLAEYQRLGEVGVLTEDDRVELLEGWIAPKMVHNPPHDNAVELLDEALRPRLREGWRIRIQSSITTSDSEPEPDIAIVRGSARLRGSRHPTADEVALVIEVADSSLSTDRGTKARIYARAGIPQYWILNLADRQLEVMTHPSGPVQSPAYASREIKRATDRLSVIIDENTIGQIDIADILP